MQHFSCGIDFGTSNSSLSVSTPGQNPFLIPLEDQKYTIPSAIFYEAGIPHPIFGRSASSAYMLGREGRFMRSLKRVLGTDLMAAGTQVNGKNMFFSDILMQFICHLKKCAEQQLSQPIENVVMGRPVHFRDHDPQGDQKAERELRQIAQMAGFKNIVFQFEPLAAAYAHEAKISGEKLACVVDIGGGTSDFSIIRIGSKHINKADRSSDILANAGIRVGGNDFDKSLCISSFMPAFGFKTTYGSKNLPVPSSHYFDLAEWSKVNTVYSFVNKRIIKQVLSEAHQPNLYQRLEQLVEKEQGHRLLDLVENVKIALTAQNDVKAIISFIQGNPIVEVESSSFSLAIANNVRQIASSLKECLKMAAVSAQQIDLLILTGGSTEIPYLKAQMQQLFEQAQVSENDKLSSVALGLGYDCIRHF